MIQYLDPVVDGVDPGSGNQVIVRGFTLYCNSANKTLLFQGAYGTRYQFIAGIGTNEFQDGLELIFSPGESFDVSCTGSTLVLDYYISLYVSDAVASPPSPPPPPTSQRSFRFNDKQNSMYVGMGF